MKENIEKRRKMNNWNKMYKNLKKHVIKNTNYTKTIPTKPQAKKRKSYYQKNNVGKEKNELKETKK